MGLDWGRGRPADVDQQALSRVLRAGERDRIGADVHPPANARPAEQLPQVTESA